MELQQDCRTTKDRQDCTKTLGDPQTASKCRPFAPEPASHRNRSGITERHPPKTLQCRRYLLQSRNSTIHTANPTIPTDRPKSITFSLGCPHQACPTLHPAAAPTSPTQHNPQSSRNPHAISESRCNPRTVGPETIEPETGGGGAESQRATRGQPPDTPPLSRPQTEYFQSSRNHRDPNPPEGSINRCTTSHRRPRPAHAHAQPNLCNPYAIHNQTAILLQSQNPNAMDERWAGEHRTRDRGGRRANTPEERAASRHANPEQSVTAEHVSTPTQYLQLPCNPQSPCNPVAILKSHTNR